jgi:hypothetical protein
MSQIDELLKDPEIKTYTERSLAPDPIMGN